MEADRGVAVEAAVEAEVAAVAVVVVFLEADGGQEEDQVQVLICLHGYSVKQKTKLYPIRLRLILQQMKMISLKAVDQVMDGLVLLLLLSVDSVIWALNLNRKGLPREK